MNSASIYTTIIGDAGSPRVHSGMHYYFYEAAKSVCPSLTPLKLSYEDSWNHVGKRVWALSQLAMFRKPRGYQYSNRCLEQIWAPVRGQVADSGIINFFQLYPESVIKDLSIDVWFYIDLTLQQLFDLYGIGKFVSQVNRKSAQARERDGYLRARRIFAMSQYVAESLVADYGISSEKICVVLPGANLPRALLTGETQLPPVSCDATPFVIGFVGKDWRRKGLDKLIRAVKIARCEHIDLRLRVVGFAPQEVPLEMRKCDFVEWCGQIDKQSEPDRFVKAVSTCHLGCLLSNADASPMALREFQALGIPTIATAVGGCREMAPPSASVVLPQDVDDATVADVLAKLARRGDTFVELRTNAMKYRATATWEHAARVVMSDIMADARTIRAGV